MQTYISILRGINVSGQKKILMNDLKALYHDLKFEDVVTYIQSGNVIFKTNPLLSDKQLGDKIEKEILKKYNFQVPVIIRNIKEVAALIKKNPFSKKKNIDPEKLHVTFLSESPSTENIETIKGFNYPPDEFIIIEREVFLHCPINYGETKLSNKFFENKLKVSATTRNWKTVNKLYEMAETN